MGQPWKDPSFAQAWDARHLSGNPARAEHLAILLDLFQDLPPGVVLDLGCGSGLVAEMILERCPELTIVGVDSSAAMLDLARERLGHFGPRASVSDGDLARLDAVAASSGCSAAIAVQSLHHLTEAAYRAAARWTFDHLAPDAWFVIIDRLAIPAPDLYPAFVRTRARQGHWPNPEDWTGYLDWLEGNHDRPLAAQTILAILEDAGFAAATLDVRGDRGMLIARRPRSSEGAQR